VEVLATVQSDPIPGSPPSSRKVVLLRRGQSRPHVEPVLVEVSQDAALWSMNDVIRQNLRLRDASDESNRRPIRAPASVASQPESGNFEDLLQDLRTGLLDFPLGMGADVIRDELWLFFGLLRKFGGVVTGTFDQLVHRFLHEFHLDTLLSLQASWLRTTARGRNHSTGEKSEVDTAAENSQSPELGPILNESVSETEHASSEFTRQWVGVAIQDFKEVKQEVEVTQEKRKESIKERVADLSAMSGQLSDITDQLKAGMLQKVMNVLKQRVTEGDDDEDANEEASSEVLKTSDDNVKTRVTVKVLKVGDMIDGEDRSDMMKRIMSQMQNSNHEDDGSVRQFEVNEADSGSVKQLMDMLLEGLSSDNNEDSGEDLDDSDLQDINVQEDDVQEADVQEDV